MRILYTIGGSLLIALGILLYVLALLDELSVRKALPDYLNPQEFPEKFEQVRQ